MASGIMKEVDLTLHGVHLGSLTSNDIASMQSAIRDTLLASATSLAIEDMHDITFTTNKFNQTVATLYFKESVAVLTFVSAIEMINAAVAAGTFAAEVTIDGVHRTVAIDAIDFSRSYVNDRDRVFESPNKKNRSATLAGAVAGGMLGFVAVVAVALMTRHTAAKSQRGLLSDRQVPKVTDARYWEVESADPFNAERTSPFMHSEYDTSEVAVDPGGSVRSELTYTSHLNSEHNPSALVVVDPEEGSLRSELTYESHHFKMTEVATEISVSDIQSFFNELGDLENESKMADDLLAMSDSGGPDDASSTSSGYPGIVFAEPPRKVSWTHTSQLSLGAETPAAFSGRNTPSPVKQSAKWITGLPTLSQPMPTPRMGRTHSGLVSQPLHHTHHRGRAATASGTVFVHSSGGTNFVRNQPCTSSTSSIFTSSTISTHC
jgi:hypothetical protein